MIEKYTKEKNLSWFEAKRFFVSKSLDNVESSNLFTRATEMKLISSS